MTVPVDNSIVSQSFLDIFYIYIFSVTHFENNNILSGLNTQKKKKKTLEIVAFEIFSFFDCHDGQRITSKSVSQYVLPKFKYEIIKGTKFVQCFDVGAHFIGKTGGGVNELKSWS